MRDESLAGPIRKPGVVGVPGGGVNAFGGKGVNAQTWKEAGQDSTMEQDAVWVYQHLALDPKHVKPTDAPSSGAWGLYNWARESRMNRDKFYSAHVLSIKVDEASQRKARQRDGEEQIKRLEALLERHRPKRRRSQRRVPDRRTERGPRVPVVPD